MTRIERVTSPLPRECSTTELHGLKLSGAGEGNRTLVISLEGFCSTIELHPPACLKIPSLRNSAHRTKNPPPQQPPPQPFRVLPLIHGLRPKPGGGGWIRTNVGARPTDLQSAPFSRSGTPPAEPEILRLFHRLVKKLPALSRSTAAPVWHRARGGHYHGVERGNKCASPYSKTIPTSWPSSASG